MPEGSESYLERKFREVSLINRCLTAPLDLPLPQSAAGVIDRKFLLAAALRAERSLQGWAVTETTRTEKKQWASGAFQFRFGYQRADLTVCGPAVYKALRGPPGSTLFQKTLYTGSGMSAIAGLFTSLLRLHERIDVLTPRSCYGETRELMKQLGTRINVIPPERWRAGKMDPEKILRVLLLDSCTESRFLDFLDLPPQDFHLAMFDTTCFWRGSSRIDRVAQWALGAGLPLALLRSHAKLDCLGIEYGRLGSIVLAAACRHPESARWRWMSGLAREIRDSIRLYGAAPTPANFPPFAGMPGYERCSVARTASIMRNTRRLYRLLAGQSGHSPIVTAFQHGLYLSLSPRGNRRMRHVRNAAAGLCETLAARGLPVRHAGSFGFDFVAIEWFPDPISRRNVLRVAPGDLPIALMDEVAAGIDHWWSAQRIPISPGGTGRAQERRQEYPSARSGEHVALA